MNALTSTERRYVQVANRLLEDIRSGRCPIGTRLPTEIALAEQFGVSRQTVREAMRRLQDLGLVARQQGVGTRVTADVPQPSQANLFTMVCDVQMEGDDFGRFDRDVVLRVLTSAEVHAGEWASLLRCGPNQRWLRVTGGRTQAHTGTPISHNEVFLPVRFAAIGPRIGVDTVPIYQMLEERYALKVTEVEQEVRAAACPAGIAEALGLGAGSPVLAITRHHFSAARELVEVTVSTYAAERFVHRITLRAGAPGRRPSEAAALEALGLARS